MTNSAEQKDILIDQHTRDFNRLLLRVAVTQSMDAEDVDELKKLLKALAGDKLDVSDLRFDELDRLSLNTFITLHIKNQSIKPPETH